MKQVESKEVMDMSVTSKDTQYGIESWFLVRKRCLLPLLPKGILPYTRFGLGMIAIGVWKHVVSQVNLPPTIKLMFHPFSQVN